MKVLPLAVGSAAASGNGGAGRLPPGEAAGHARDAGATAPPPGAPPGALRLIERLQPRAAEMAAAMTESIRLEFAEVEGDDPGRQKEAVLAMVESFLHMVRENRPMDVAERERFAAVGADALRAGVSLASVLGSVRVAARIGWLFASAEARALRPRSAALPALEEFGLLLFNFVAELCDVIAAGHDSAARLRDKLLAEPAESLVDELLRGSSRSPAELARRADNVGLLARGTYGILAVMGEAPATDPAAILAAAEACAACARPRGVAVMLGGTTTHAVVLAPLPGAAVWPKLVERMEAAAISQPVRLLVAAAVPTLLDVSTTYRRLRRMLLVARAAAPSRHTTWEGDLAVERLLDEVGEEERRQYVELLLRSVLTLPEARRARLLEALAAWACADGVTAEAAKRLGLHPKSIRYRLLRIRELTGLDVGRPADRFRLELAGRFLSMSAEEKWGD
ncbi:MAG: PucR family transcriptional regulator [Candidatus Dormibacteria bacterium]